LNPMDTIPSFSFKIRMNILLVSEDLFNFLAYFPYVEKTE
jgi:hypothetical protein